MSGATGDAGRIVALEEALGVTRGLGLVRPPPGATAPGTSSLLLRLGCRHAEGAFIAEPMTGGELAAWTGRWSPPSVLGESA